MSSNPFIGKVPRFNLTDTVWVALSAGIQEEILRWTYPLNACPIGLYITSHEEALAIADGAAPKQKPVAVDFFSSAAVHRQRYGGGRSQAIAKAIGLPKRADISVLDATAGLGRDAWVLASLGARVWMLERHPIVRLLLLDGLNRAFKAGLEPETMRLLEGNLIEGIQGVNQPDVVYLDPMFPERRSSAAVKKEMTVFHDLVGPDADADALLEPALALARYRVVVKRPRHAPDLGGQKPGLVLSGKSSRFDIYPIKSL
ncbi:MAG: class I SAM-dependent methyltransferase [Saccharospirillum sp.]|nr:class I SAM-dependent methyltransferase [Saccharospirillum sp.]